MRDVGRSLAAEWGEGRAEDKQEPAGVRVGFGEVCVVGPQGPRRDRMAAGVRMDPEEGCLPGRRQEECGELCGMGGGSPLRVSWGRRWVRRIRAQKEESGTWVRRAAVCAGRGT